MHVKNTGIIKLFEYAGFEVSKIEYAANIVLFKNAGANSVCMFACIWVKALFCTLTIYAFMCVYTRAYAHAFAYN
jgi:hypothetical protein